MLCKLIAVLALTGLVTGRFREPTNPFPVSKINDGYKKECIKYHADMEKIQAAITRANECINAELDHNTTLVILAARIFMDQEHVAPAIKAVCDKKEQLQICLFDLTDALIPCVDPELRGKVNDSKKAYQDFGDYVCANDGEVINKLFGEEEMRCLTTDGLNQQLSRCIIDLNTQNLESSSPAVRCAEFYKAKDCILGALRQCPTKTQADFMERFFDTLVVGSHCEHRPSSITNDIISIVTTTERPRPKSAYSKYNSALRKKCIKNNVDIARIEAEFDKTMQCVQAELDDETKSLLIRAKLTGNGEYGIAAAKNLCTKKEQFGLCLDKWIDFSASCIDPELRPRLNASKSAMRDFGYYLCANDLEIIKKIYDKEEVSCLENNDMGRKLKQCTAPLDAIDLDTVTDTERCSAYYNMKSCTIQTLKQCTPHTLADVLEKFMDAVEVSSDCESMLINNEINVHNPVNPVIICDETSYGGHPLPAALLPPLRKVQHRCEQGGVSPLPL